MEEELELKQQKEDELSQLLLLVEEWINRVKKKFSYGWYWPDCNITKINK